MVNIDYLYNPDFVKKSNLFNTNYFIDKKLGFSVIEHGTILPHKLPDAKGENWGGGIADSKGKYITSSFINDSGGGKIYTPPPEAIQHSSETVIYLTMFYPVWGHVITDNIRRLWFLNNDVFRNEFKNCPIVYIPWREGYYTMDRMVDAKRLLEILGVDLNRLQPITQPTQFDKIVLFDEAFVFNAYFTNEYREMIDIVRNFALKNRTPISNKKVYFFYGNNQIGEERLAEYFKSKGYEIITHEKRLNFDEELNFLINCESFASTLGSCAHNSLFLRDGTETIFIPRAFNEFTGYQQKLDQVHPLNVNYVDSTMSIFNVRHDSYCFIISEQLKGFFGDKFDGYAEEDFKIFLEYVKSPIRKNRGINYTKMKGYESVFADFITQLKKRDNLITAYNMQLGWEKFRPSLIYQTHVHMKGRSDGWKSENQISNPLDQKLDVLAIRIDFSNYKVYYSVYFNDKEGWSPEVLAPEIAGTTRIHKPIYGMRIRFDEAGAKEFDILYRMHKFDNTWTPWAKNGEALYSHGVKLNAIQIKLESKPIPAKKTEVMPQP